MAQRSPARVPRAFSPLSGRASNTTTPHETNVSVAPPTHLQAKEGGNLQKPGAAGTAADGVPGSEGGSKTSSIGHAATLLTTGSGIEGTPNATREKENLRHTLEAIAREAAQIQKELDGSAAPSLRARLNAAAALGKPLPADVTSLPSMAEPLAPTVAMANDAAAAKAEIAAGPGMDSDAVTATPARAGSQVIRAGRMQSRSIEIMQGLDDCQLPLISCSRQCCNFDALPGIWDWHRDQGSCKGFHFLLHGLWSGRSVIFQHRFS